MPAKTNDELSREKSAAALELREKEWRIRQTEIAAKFRQKLKNPPESSVITFAKEGSELTKERTNTDLPLKEHRGKSKDDVIDLIEKLYVGVSTINTMHFDKMHFDKMHFDKMHFYREFQHDLQVTIVSLAKKIITLHEDENIPSSALQKIRDAVTSKVTKHRNAIMEVQQQTETKIFWSGTGDHSYNDIRESLDPKNIENICSEIITEENERVAKKNEDLIKIFEKDLYNLLKNTIDSTLDFWSKKVRGRGELLLMEGAKKFSGRVPKGIRSLMNTNHLDDLTKAAKEHANRRICKCRFFNSFITGRDSATQSFYDLVATADFKNIKNPADAVQKLEYFKQQLKEMGLLNNIKAKPTSSNSPQ